MVVTIHIEGIDRTGKDTLAKKLSEMSNLKYYITSRSPISTYAYAVKNERTSFSFKELIQYFKNNQIRLVYLVPNKKIIDERCKNTGHEKIDNWDYEYFNEIVKKLKSCGIKVVEIEDINEDPEKISYRILEELEND